MRTFEIIYPGGGIKRIECDHLLIEGDIAFFCLHAGRDNWFFAARGWLAIEELQPFKDV